MKKRFTALLLSICMTMALLLQVSQVTAKSSADTTTQGNHASAMLESNEGFSLDGNRIDLTKISVSNKGGSIEGICSEQLPEEKEIQLLIKDDLGNGARFRLARVEDKKLLFLPEDRILGMRALANSKTLEAQIYARDII